MGELLDNSSVGCQTDGRLLALPTSCPRTTVDANRLACGSYLLMPR